MKVCYECGASNYVTPIEDKYICEKCMIWYDYDEQIILIDEYGNECELEFLYPGDPGYDYERDESTD